LRLLNVEKLKHKLRYSIDLGVDFLIRNLDNEGVIAGEQSLYRHCLATLCIVRNASEQTNKIELCLSRISSYSYVDGNRFFLMDENEKSISSVNAIAALSFLLFGKRECGIRFARTVANRQLDDGSIYLCEKKSKEFEHEIGKCVELFVTLYELTNSNSWLKKAILSRDWIVEHGDLSDHWNMIALNHIKDFNDTEEAEKFRINMMSLPKVSLDVSAVYDEVFIDERIEQECYDRLKAQLPPSNLWKGGAFVNEEQKIRIDLIQKNVSTFNRILNILTREKTK